MEFRAIACCQVWHGSADCSLTLLSPPYSLAALALTVVGSSAMFTVFTYIAPILSSETQASTAFITAMLVLHGIGLTLGNMWGGKAADRSVDRTLTVSLSVLILVLLAFIVLMRWPPWPS